MKRITVAKMEFLGCGARDPRITKSNHFKRAIVIAYMIFRFGQDVSSHAYIFKSNGRLYGVVDGRMSGVLAAYERIRSAKLKMHYPIDRKTQNEIERALLLERV